MPNRRAKKQDVLFCCLIILCVGTLFSCSVQEKLEWHEVLTTIRKQHPTIKQMTTQQLAQLLSSEEAENPLVIDARDSREYEVSHIRHAQMAATKEQSVEMINSKDQLVVIYCSVGYRSSNLAKELQVVGYTRVYNLEGGVFKWANEGFPLYKGVQRVNHVHPYNEEWGALLKKNFWPNRAAFLD